MNSHHAPVDLTEPVRDIDETANDNTASGYGARAEALGLTADRLRTIATVAGSYATIRALFMVADLARRGPRVLDMLGLQRRPGVLARAVMGVGFIAGGIAVGAGIAMLSAPRNGIPSRPVGGRSPRVVSRDGRGIVERTVDSVKTTLANGTRSAKPSTDSPKTDATQASSPRAESGARAWSEPTKNDR